MIARLLAVLRPCRWYRLGIHDWRPIVWDELTVTIHSTGTTVPAVGYGRACDHCLQADLDVLEAKS